MSRLRALSLAFAICVVVVGGGVAAACAALPSDFSWTPASPSSVAVNDGAVRQIGELWVVGEDGAYSTTNTGQSWVAVPSAGTWLNGVAFPDPQHGWVSGQNSLIKHTVDGGATWTTQTAPFKSFLGAVHSTDASHAWIPVAGSTAAVVFSTDDAGSTWLRSDIGTTTNVQGVDFADNDRGWAVGYGGMVAKSENGGDTWALQVSGVSADLRGVAALDASTAVAVGAGGVAIRTADGGATWTPCVTSNANTLYSVKFLSPTEGWAAGFNVVLHTLDAGATWQVEAVPDGTTLYGVGLLHGDRRTVYFPGWQKVLKYTLPSFDISPIAGKHLSITPSTIQAVEKWSDSPTFTVTPDKGYAITGLLIDGAPLAGPTKYAFRSVIATHSIGAVAAPVKTHITIARTPSGSSKTYHRKSGVAKFVLYARLVGPAYHIAKSTIRLQSSTNGKTWHTIKTLTASTLGKASRTIHATTRGTRYYRWTTPDTTKHYSASSTRFKSVIK